MKSYLKKYFLPSILAFSLVLVITVIALWRGGYEPFGDFSLMFGDGAIQYRYFFSYFKDVLQGKNSINYSFSIGLGQTGIGILSYYLMSPVNLLVLFFEKSDINIFSDLIVVMKLCLAAASMAIYLQYRYNGKIPLLFQVLLSASWGLMQFSMEQLENIMWLDGVILLPLLLGSIYDLVHNKTFAPLSIIVALSIIIQWYTAAINCIFAIFWFLFEYFLDNRNKNFKDFLSTGSLFVWAMALGVLISSILFIPNVFSLQTGKGGSFDWWMFSNTFRGNVLTAIVDYSIGAESTQEMVSLYAGSFVLVGCLGGISINSNKKKWIYACMLALCVMFFYWQPFFTIFSLLKDASSYFYRYAYVSIFTIIFIAASFYSDKNQITAGLFKNAFVFAFLILLLNKVFSIREETDVYTFAFIVFVVTGLVLWYANGNAKIIAVVVLLFVFSLEFYSNTEKLFNTNKVNDVVTYHDYTEELENVSANLRAYDSDNYRISIVPAWVSSENGITAQYSELMGIGEWGIASYNSAPDYIYLDFLAQIGYRHEGGCIQVVNTSIIPVDTMLGVKYVISSFPIHGFELVEDLPQVYGKSVYRNPNALPMAFRYNPYDGLSLDAENQFEYVNKLWTRLSANEDKIFKPVETVRTETKTGVRWSFMGKEGDGVMYGNIPWWRYDSLSIDVNGKHNQTYAGWLSPSVFRIPCQNEESYIEIKTQDKDLFQTAQIYWFDEAAMRNHINWMLSRGGNVENIKIENGYISCEANAGKDEKLFLSVPANKGWTAYRNGEKIEIEKFADALINIPLVEGENFIELKYQVPGLYLGMIVSASGIILLIISQILIMSRRKTVVINTIDTNENQKEILC